MGVKDSTETQSKHSHPPSQNIRNMHRNGNNNDSAQACTRRTPGGRWASTKLYNAVMLIYFYDPEAVIGGLKSVNSKTK